MVAKYNEHREKEILIPSGDFDPAARLPEGHRHALPTINCYPILTNCRTASRKCSIPAVEALHNTCFFEKTIANGNP
jgi:hypothetical protein